MKKLILLIIILFSTGCLSNDDIENKTIYTSGYPIEFITKYLFTSNPNIVSIYPRGIDPESYELTDKQVKDYSKGYMFIYDKYGNESKLTVEFRNNNNNIKIIDATLGMEYTNSKEELWLDPFNFLMLAQNIKRGLSQYIVNPYTIKEIETNYETLEYTLTEIDINLKNSIENATIDTVVVSSDVFMFLEKYGLNVISLEENINLTEKNIADAYALKEAGKLRYIYAIKGEKLNDTVSKFVSDTGVEVKYFNDLSSISEEEISNGDDFISITKNNINLLIEGIK